MSDTAPSWQCLALLPALCAFSSAACNSLRVDNSQLVQPDISQSGASGSGSGDADTDAGTTAQAGSGNPGGNGGAGAGSVGAGGGSSSDAGTPASGGSSGEAGPAPEHVLLDLAGASTGSALKTVIDWDLREKFTFNVSEGLATSATVEVVNSQAELAFAQTDPDPTGTNNALQVVKIPAATGNGDNWGGWAHIIFDLGYAIPQDLVSALPQWDNDSSSLVAGTRVIQLDVYYDDTVDPNFDWDKLLALENAGTDIWNAVTAQGYKVDLQLVNYAAHADVSGAHDSAGIYIGYSAYLTQPNTWMTLTFDAADEGRAANYFNAGSVLAATASQVTGIDIKPAGGYEPRDSNPLYIRNLRIVDLP